MRIEPYFPLSHGANDPPIVGGILFVIRNGWRWRDAPPSMARRRRSTTALSGGVGSQC